MSGEPCITGTRIPISLILILLKRGETIDDIQKGYPHVDRKKIEGAIDEVIASYENKPYENPAL